MKNAGSDDPKQAFAEFTIIRKIGEGAMGVVYKARQPSHDRDVALKVMFPHLATNPTLVARLHREALAMATLDHPNIVQAYATGQDRGRHYVAMEYVRGKNLSIWLKRIGRFSVADAVLITLACARALAYAHEHGIIHRDIKPGNVLLTPSGEIKIADFGMVKDLDEDAALTQAGHGLGTLVYMPLEQAQDAKDCDGRADIYALGCTLYCLLTGNAPFAADSMLEVVRAKEQGTFPLARSLNPDVPERLDLIIAKMTAKLPRYRYQTCAEVITDLESLGLAGATLSLTVQSAPAETAPQREYVAAKTDTLDLNLWYIYQRRADGQTVLRKYITSEIVAGLSDGSIDPRTKASHHPQEGFRALATYQEFKGIALAKARKIAADDQSVRYQSAYRKIEEKLESEANPQDTSSPHQWVGPAMLIVIAVLAVAAIGALLYWAIIGW